MGRPCRTGKTIGTPHGSSLQTRGRALRLEMQRSSSLCRLRTVPAWAVDGMWVDCGGNIMYPKIACRGIACQCPKTREKGLYKIGPYRQSEPTRETQPICHNCYLRFFQCVYLLRNFAMLSGKHAYIDILKQGCVASSTFTLTP